MKRFLAVLLALAMLFAMAGCVEQEAEPTETTTPLMEQYTKIYQDACAALNAAGTVSLDVKLTSTMLVEDQQFVTENQQVVTYSGLGTDAVLIQMEENVKYSEDEEEKEDDEEVTSLYTEIYGDGAVYVTLDGGASFTGAMSQEESTARYVPVCLFDPALYGDITMETSGDVQSITFAEPTAAEAWAIPAEAELVEASGVAQITADGAVKSMEYTVSFKYGTAQYTCEVETAPRAEATQVALPEDADSYTVLQYPLALYTMISANNVRELAESIAVNHNENYLSYAGGVQASVGNTTYVHGTGKDMLMKMDEYTHVYSTQGNESYETEMVYKDGKLVITVDDGVPTTQTGVTASRMQEVITTQLETCMVPTAYWQDVTATELGGAILLEFTYNEDFGNNTQNSVCTKLFQSPSVLNQMASAYENKEMTGYLSVEKYTGLAVAAGMNFEGAHTIQGEEYEIALQVDQSFEIPSYGAYHEITDEYLEDEKPENLAKPLFYKVTGENGQQMWLLGTIHVGDSRTAYLPQELIDAVTSSDAIAFEIDNDSLEERVENDTKLQKAISQIYYYSDGSAAEDHMEEELYAKCVQFLKATGNYNDNTKYMKPGMWENFIQQYYVRTSHSLRIEHGVEEQLTRIAKENEIPIREVEDVLEHMKLGTNWSEELQTGLLEDTMEAAFLEYVQEAQEMYELWCAGDEAALREMVNEEPDLSELTEEELAEYEAQKPLREEYDKGMQFDRNEKMLKVAKQYLESGEVVFYAVGLAHLLDDTNGLVEALRAEGYTVEIVTYK